MTPDWLMWLVVADYGAAKKPFAALGSGLRFWYPGDIMLGCNRKLGFPRFWKLGIPRLAPFKLRHLLRICHSYSAAVKLA